MNLYGNIDFRKDFERKNLKRNYFEMEDYSHVC